MNSTVWANGQKLGERPYGWIFFEYDISDIVAEIIFAEHVDNAKQLATWWYIGSAIYADDCITESYPVHIEREGGIYITTDGAIVLQLSESFAEDEGFVRNNPDYTPEPLVSNSLEAEDAAFEGASFSIYGSGFLNFAQNSQGYVEWYRENDGDEYEAIVNIHYGCGRNRLVYVIVNDVEIATSLTLASTRLWGNDWPSQSIQGIIQRGANTICIQNRGFGGPYIDRIFLSTVVSRR